MMIFSPGRLPAGCLTASTDATLAASKHEGNRAPRRRQKRERRRVLITQRTLEDSSPLPFCLSGLLNVEKLSSRLLPCGNIPGYFGSFPPQPMLFCPSEEKPNYYQPSRGMLERSLFREIFPPFLLRSAIFFTALHLPAFSSNPVSFFSVAT